MNTDLDFLVKKARIDEWLREAENSRLVYEAVRSDPKQGRQQIVHLPLNLFSQTLAGAGRILIQAGSWLENRYSNPRPPVFNVKTHDY